MNIKNITGLSAQEALTRINQEGYNELPSGKKRSIFTMIFKIIAEPMFLMLITGAALYFILGDGKEALMLLSFVIVIMGITLHQEHKTERALETLRSLSSPRALVIRDGKEERLAGREVVRGDILIVREGDYIAADAKIVSSSNLIIDESLLTGESTSIYKSDKQPIYASTLVLQGYGLAEVTAIGANTEFGKIGKALTKIDPEHTPLQRMTGKLVRNIAIVGICFCTLIAIIFGVTRGDYLQGVLVAITLAMAILPEEFPVILTTFLALGAWRISKENVLTRSVPAIEALGSATVLCVDKTGTLTLNEMQVQRMFIPQAKGYRDTFTVHDFCEQKDAASFIEFIHYSVLAGQRDPFDPMEKAIKRFADEYENSECRFLKDWSLLKQYPLSPELLAISHVWQSNSSEHYEVAAKGAPEAIFDLCHLSREDIEKFSQQVKSMARDGLRVLGVAKAVQSNNEMPQIQHDFKFTFLGLIGLADPLRPTVRESVQKCYEAGIRVVMITGDYPETAVNIATQIGLNSSNNVLTGKELSELDNESLQDRIKDINVFARIVPEQKLRIVNALRANGAVVAMTGDGVNDAPALKAAHIGVAMGMRGTDVAREASDLVLLDDDFSSIVHAINLGRRIFTNIKKAMTYTLAVHIPIIGMSFLPVLFKLPLILLPIHIVFLELIIDPACSVAFEAEPEDPDTMKTPPRSPSEPLFSKSMLLVSLWQGGSVFLITALIYFSAKFFGYSEVHIRTLTFATLVITNLSLILINRSYKKRFWNNFTTHNTVLLWILAGALAFLIAITSMPFLRDLFKFSVLDSRDYIACFSAGIFVLSSFELIKHKLYNVVP